MNGKAGHNPGSTLVHTALCCIIPCVGYHDHAHSHRIAGRYSYRRALIGSGRPSRIALLPVPHRGEVLCAAPVPLLY